MASKRRTSRDIPFTIFLTVLGAGWGFSGWLLAMLVFTVIPPIRPLLDCLEFSMGGADVAGSGVLFLVMVVCGVIWTQVAVRQPE